LSTHHRIIGRWPRRVHRLQAARSRSVAGVL